MNNKKQTKQEWKIVRELWKTCWLWMLSKDDICEELTSPSGGGKG